MDLGPDAARHAADHVAAGYTAARPPADAEQLAAALDRLRAAWDTQVAARASLDRARLDVADAEEKADWWRHCHAILDPLADRYQAAKQYAQRAEDAAHASRDALANAIREHRAELQHVWYADLRSAHDAVHTIEAGSGRLGLHRARVRDAYAALDAWTERWGDVLAEASVTPETDRHPRRMLDAATEHGVAILYRHAQHLAATEYPDPDTLRAAAQAARSAADAALLTWRHQHAQVDRERRVPYRDPTPDLDAPPDGPVPPGTAPLARTRRLPRHAPTRLSAASPTPPGSSPPGCGGNPTATSSGPASTPRCCAPRAPTGNEPPPGDRERLPTIPRPPSAGPASASDRAPIGTGTRVSHVDSDGFCRPPAPIDDGRA